VEVIAPPGTFGTGSPLLQAPLDHPDSRGGARVRAFRMIRDLQDGVAVSEVAIDEFIANAERRGWPEVARAGLFSHVGQSWPPVYALRKRDRPSGGRSLMSALAIQVVMDCADPSRLAEFWAEALGYIVQPPPPGFASWEEFADNIGLPEDDRDRLAAVVDPEGAKPRVLFQKVPEPKTTKNRVHVDIDVSPGVPGGSDERKAQARTRAGQLTARGATLLREVDEPTGWCLVMADPEGNEFCLH
jgi:hypothetical protein